MGHREEALPTKDLAEKIAAYLAARFFVGKASYSEISSVVGRALPAERRNRRAVPALHKRLSSIVGAAQPRE